MIPNSFTKQILIIFALCLISPYSECAERVYPFVNRYDHIIESMETLENLHIFKDTLSNKKNSSKDYPTFPDLVYEYKIAAIGKLSPIDFDYNPKVKRYIDIYSIERREQVSQMLGLSQLYFPIFEEILDKYQLPLELKYLAIVESALNPLAVSKSGAAGLWQFKINSARMFNLNVNSYIDERMDPVKSTDAACQYLQYLYKIFNNWHLALAAYNTGPGPVRNAIARANGETNFWKIYDYLPEAAQNYVPAFIAAAYIMNNASTHKINVIKPIIDYNRTDSVMITQPLYFTAIEKELNLPIGIIRFLNPMYRRDYIPEIDKPVTLWLPSEMVEQFIKKEQTIYNTKSKVATYQDIVSKSGSTEGKTEISYNVKSGDYLHKIAILHGCTVDDLLIWNPISDDNLSVGENLIIWVDKKIYQRLIQSNSPDSLRVKRN